MIRHYSATDITSIAAARLKSLAEHYSTVEFPVKFDTPIVHAGSLLMISTMNYKRRLGSIQVPIQAGIFDPHVFEQTIDTKVEHIFTLMNTEDAA